MNKLFRRLLSWLEIGGTEAVFVFLTLLTGTVCTAIGFPYGQPWTPDRFWEIPLMQIGAGMTLLSFLLYLFTMRGGDKRLFLICFAFSLLFHAGLFVYSAKTTVATTLVFLPGDEHSELNLSASAPEPTRDYFWHDEVPKQTPREFIPDYDPSNRNPYSDRDVTEELEKLRKETVAPVKQVEPPMEEMEKWSDQPKLEVPESPEKTVDTEQLARPESLVKESQTLTNLSRTLQIADETVPLQPSEPNVRVIDRNLGDSLNLREEMEKRKAKSSRPVTRNEEIEKAGKTARTGAVQQWGETPESASSEDPQHAQSKVRPGAGETADRATSEFAIPENAEQGEKHGSAQAAETASTGGETTGERHNRSTLDDEAYENFLAGSVDGLSDQVLETLVRQEPHTGSNLLGDQPLDLTEDIIVFRHTPSELPELGNSAVLSTMPEEGGDTEEDLDAAGEAVAVAAGPTLLEHSVSIVPVPMEPYRQRMRANHRNLIQEGGGDPDTERMVEDGLACLEAMQFPDGHWAFNRLPKHMKVNPDDASLGTMPAQTGATGLALLAFLGSGYTHLEEHPGNDYRDTVARGLSWLLRNQQSDGSLFQEKTDLNRYSRIYSHGIASIALCEAYGMTRAPELREPAQRAIDFIVKHQSPRGGWRYTPARPQDPWSGESDTSVSGWQVMALVSARMAGLEVPETAFQNVEKWLQQAAINGGEQFCYMPLSSAVGERKNWNKPSYAMTAEGLLMQLYLGYDKDHEKFSKALEYLSGNLPDMNSKRRNTYYWYYATQVMFHMHDARWQEWQQRLISTLKASQESEGPFKGSWSPLKPSMDEHGTYGGRLYVTTMHLLILEVYYRHLPLFRELTEDKK
ncbi:MAG: terpene cyclase/mutase family protein [Planctomycetia bacterium]|nr:terpene cyclase/mutase family protein [Planctomycetia bacterium]